MSTEYKSKKKSERTAHKKKVHNSKCNKCDLTTYIETELNEHMNYSHELWKINERLQKTDNWKS